MNVKDVSALVNEVYNEITGKNELITIDDTKIVDIGNELQNITSADNLYKKIADKVGKTVIKNKIYKGKLPSILRDSWEFGGLLEQIYVKPFQAVADPSVSPVAGTYDSMNHYDPAEISVKYYSKTANFQIPYWKPNSQLWTAFKSVADMTRFLSGIEVAVANSLELRIQGLIKEAIGNFIAQVAHKASPEGAYSTTSTITCRNLLKEYNDLNGTTLTTETMLRDAGFLKYLVEELMNTRDRMTDMSSLLNIDGIDTFTNEEDINLVLLSTVANATKVNMQSDVYHKELVELPNYETVPYWQGSGGNYDAGTIGEISKTIEITTDEGVKTTADVEFTGILGCMFAKDAVAVNCEHKVTTTAYNADLDQTKFYDKYNASFINDFAENFVVFYAA